MSCVPTPPPPPPSFAPTVIHLYKLKQFQQRRPMTLFLLSCHIHNTKGLMPRSCSWTWVADVEGIGWSEAKQALGSKPQQWAVCWCVGSPPLIPWRIWVSLANEQESVWYPSTAAFWNMSVVFLPGGIWLTLSCYRSRPVWNAMHNFSSVICLFLHYSLRHC